MSGRLDDEEILLKNVQDLKKRLEKTEHSLQSISSLQSGSPGSGNRKTEKTKRKSPIIKEKFPVLRLEDLVTQDRQSDISLSSLRSSDSVHYDPRRPGPIYSTPNDKKKAHGPSSVTSSIVSDYENETLRKKVHLLQDENSQIVAQNHKLLMELERTGYDLHQANNKVDLMASELQRKDEMEERVKYLDAEIESRERTLREIEERFEGVQHKLDRTINDLSLSQQQFQSLHVELQEEKRLRKRAENQKTEALRSIDDLQASVNQYQERTQEKLHKQQDSLSKAEGNKRDLLHEVNLLKQQLGDTEEEFNRYRNQSQKDDERGGHLEDQNLELRTQLARQVQRIGKLESEARLVSTIESENSELKVKVQQQQKQLKVCTQEIEESQGQLEQLERLAEKLQCRERTSETQRGNWSSVDIDSGISSNVKKSLDFGVQKENNSPERLPTSPVGSSAKAVIAQLRLKLAMKEEEIQHLQSNLQRASSSLEDRPPSQMDTLRNELMTVVERSKLGDKKSLELEQIVTELEGERSKMAAELLVLEEKLSDKEGECTSLETATERLNAQLTDLQKNMYDTKNELEQLHREARKKSGQITTLEHQLDGKVTELTSCYTQNKNLEQEIAKQNDLVKKLQGEVDIKLQEVMVCSKNMNKLKEMHGEQCQEYEKQIDILQTRCEEKEVYVRKLDKESDNVSRELDQTINRLHQTEEALDSAQREFQNSKQQHEQTLMSLENQTRQSTSQVQHLEGALANCKEDIQLHIEQLSEMKDKHRKDISGKQEEINAVKKHLKHQQHDMKEKNASLSSLEKTLNERQSMLEQSTFRIGELEDIQTEMERTMSRLEQELHRSQAQFLQDTHAQEQKLHQACFDLEQRARDIQELTNTLRDVQEKKKQLTFEVNDLQKQLGQVEKDLEEKEDVVGQKENDLREVKVKLQQRSLRVDEMEDDLHQIQHDLQEQTRHSSDLDMELRKAQAELQQTSSQLGELQMLLKRSKSDVQSKEELVNEMTQNLRDSQSELEIKSREVEKLDQMLAERDQELNQRAALVTELDFTIKDHKNETEHRLVRLESSLKKSQYEIQTRTQQVAELDEKCCQLQETLREKDLQLQQSEQQIRRTKIDLDKKSDKTQQLEKQLETQKEKYNDKKVENQELNQELRLTREQLQKQQFELVETKKELMRCQREQDRLAQEVDDTVNVVHNKETDTARLAEELGVSHAREAQLEARLNSELRKMKNEMDLQEDHHQKQLDELQEVHAETMAQNDEGITQSRLRIKEFEDNEKHLQQLVSTLETEVNKMKKEVERARREVNASTEGVVIKEAEIARMQAKISGYERAVFGVRPSEMIPVTSPRINHHRSHSVRTPRNEAAMAFSVSPWKQSGPIKWSSDQNLSRGNLSDEAAANDSSVFTQTGAFDDSYINMETFPRMSGAQIRTAADIEKRSRVSRHRSRELNSLNLLPSRIPRPSTKSDISGVFTAPETDSDADIDRNTFQSMLRQVRQDLNVDGTTSTRQQKHSPSKSLSGTHLDNAASNPTKDYYDLPKTYSPQKTQSPRRQSAGDRCDLDLDLASGHADLPGGSSIHTLMQDYADDDSPVPLKRQLSEQKAKLASSSKQNDPGNMLRPEQCIVDLHAKLRTNELRRQQIQDQLHNL